MTTRNAAKHFINGMLLLAYLLSPSNISLAQNTPAFSSNIGAPKFMIIVNSENDYSANPDEIRKLIKLLYLKKVKTWPNGIEATPISRSTRSEAQTSFCRKILDMDEIELTRHWLKVKQLNGDTPPKIIDSSGMAMFAVSRGKGTFAVLRASKKNRLPTAVKVLLQF